MSANILNSIAIPAFILKRIVRYGSDGRVVGHIANGMECRRFGYGSHDHIQSCGHLLALAPSVCLAPQLHRAAQTSQRPTIYKRHVAGYRERYRVLVADGKTR